MMLSDVRLHTYLTCLCMDIFAPLEVVLTLSLDMKCITMFIGTPSVADIFLSDKTNDIKVMLVGGEAAIQGLESKSPQPS